jgi:uncharacterized protein
MEDKLALVTGASSGIGLELAKELANRGYDVVIASAGDRLTGAAEDIRSHGHQVIDVNADLATREGVNRLWAQVQLLGRPVDIACINAGVGVGGLFSETDLDSELNMVELNCVGTIQLAKLLVRHMKELNAGKILFTASIAGEMVAPRGRLRCNESICPLLRSQSPVRAEGNGYHGNCPTTGTHRHRSLPSCRDG